MKATREVGGYAPVNGLQMYFEVDGSGEPLVYIPPAFGHAGVKSFPQLTDGHAVITVDLQGHGRTADIPERPISFGQHVSDVVGLLRHLGITRADFFGESFGGVIATMIAVRHPELVRRVATYGATFGPPDVAINPKMFQSTAPPGPESKGLEFQKEHYEKVAPHPDYWPQLWQKVCSNEWNGFSDEELTSIQAPLLIALGDRDFVRLEHAVETFERVSTAELAIIPDASHFALFSEPKRVIPIVKHFLEKPDSRLRLATPETGFCPNETR